VGRRLEKRGKSRKGGEGRVTGFTGRRGGVNFGVRGQRKKSPMLLRGGGGERGGGYKTVEKGGEGKGKLEADGVGRRKVREGARNQSIMSPEKRKKRGVEGKGKRERGEREGIWV